MTNPKIEKVNAAIEKSRDKILKEKARLHDLERQKTDLENAEIIARFRREKLTEDDLNTIIMQKSGSPAPVQEAPAYTKFDERSDANE